MKRQASNASKTSRERSYLLVAFDRDGCSLEKQTEELTEEEFGVLQQGLVLYRKNTHRSRAKRPR